VRLAGDLIGENDERGEPIIGDTVLILLNAHHEAIPFTLPTTRKEHRWERLFDTASVGPAEAARQIAQGGDKYNLQGRSLAVLVARTAPESAGEIATAKAEPKAEAAKPRPKMPAVSWGQI
jgi:glycogen operon protein